MDEPEGGTRIVSEGPNRFTEHYFALARKGGLSHSLVWPMSLPPEGKEWLPLIGLALLEKRISNTFPLGSYSGLREIAYSAYQAAVMGAIAGGAAVGGIVGIEHMLK